MPRIDPLKLLTCLKVLLAPNGGIRSANEVKRLAELMAKYSKKLVSKCIYIQILKSTDTELLGKFMGVGGWSLTHMWLNDGIKAANWPLVQEILELLLLCPVDVQRLRSNTAPKLVKGLCKDGGNEGVRILATKLVEQWLKVVKGETLAASEQQAQNSQQQPPPVNGVISNTTVTIPTPAKPTTDSVAVDDIQNALVSPTKSNADDSLVYKMKVMKDGKPVLAKVVNNDAESGSVNGESGSVKEGESETSAATTGTGAKISNNTDDKLSDKENDVKTNESEDKELPKDKESDREKSRSSSSSKDKDRHRSSTSSSSSRHKSSSSKSSSSKSSSSSSRSKSSSHSSSSSSKHKDKESSDRDKHRSSTSSKSSSSSSSKDKDKSRSKDKEREKSRSSSDKEKDKSRSDKDKDRSEKDKDKESERGDSEEQCFSPSIDKLGRIPKITSEEPDEPLVTSITIPSKKASMSIEIRRGDLNRPKTVKTFKSQFRSHGLYEEAPPPPSRKGLRKPVSTAPIPGIAIPSNIAQKRSSPPPMPVTASTPAAVKELLPPAEKKLKIDLTTAPATEKPGAVKFIAPKPKPSTLVESDMFMDALSAAAPKKDVRKRKRRASNSKEPTTPEDPESPGGNNVAPLKFYQDTLEDSEKPDNNSSDDFKEDSVDDQKNDDEDDIPLKKVKEQIEEKVREKEMEERMARENEEPEENPTKKPPGPGCGPDGPPGVLMLHRRKGPKKKLSWRTQEQLEEIRFFEVDVNERVNVTKTFTDMKQIERFNERECFTLARKLNTEDVMVEQTPWVPLMEIDDVPPHPEGSQSKEKKIQMEREMTTLKALYFNRHMIPDSASEPDMEQYQITEPAVIPLDDITGNPDAVNDFTSMPWPDPKGSPPLNDEFMNGGDLGFPGGQFNPFMPFGGNGGGWMGPAMNNGPPNGMMGPPMGGPMGNFNPMMGGPPSNMMMNGGPPNMMGGMGGPDDMGGMGCNMNMMNPGFDPGFDPNFDPNFDPSFDPSFGPGGGPGGQNFGGPPNGGMGGGFNNFGPPMGMNPNGMNMNNGQRGGGGSNRGGSWRSGSAGPPGGNDGPGGGGGGNWRGGGRGGVGGNNQRRGGIGRDNGRNICKQFQRGFCRNGNKCNFFHPPGGNNQRF